MYFSEYIVSYNGYYKQPTRKRYLNAALHESGVTSWKIVQRDNPAFDYPSDFDVVKVRQITELPCFIRSFTITLYKVQ